MGELYGYDNFNQLTAFDRGTLNGTKTGLTGSASRSQDFDFDAVGNWDSLTNDGGSPQTRSHNQQNEITTVSGATSPTFDANGNMTQAETGLRYVWDAWDRLVAVKDSPGTTTLKTYSYDGLNRRVTGTASGTTTDLFYSSAWRVLEEKVGSNTTKRYVWSPVYVDAMVLRDRDTDANGTLDERLWMQHDANFNITALVDGSGNVVERYAYDPFGVVSVFDASYSVRATSLYAQTYLWQGRPIDSISGNYDFRNRDVSPTLGRPIQSDMLRFGGGDVNFYRWESNTPIGRVDPLGLSDIAMPAPAFGSSLNSPQGMQLLGQVLTGAGLAGVAAYTGSMATRPDTASYPGGYSGYGHSTTGNGYSYGGGQSFAPPFNPPFAGPGSPWSGGPYTNIGPGHGYVRTPPGMLPWRVPGAGWNSGSWAGQGATWANNAVRIGNSLNRLDELINSPSAVQSNVNAAAIAATQTQQNQRRACFAAGTPVRTPWGSLNIELIRPPAIRC